MIQYYDQNGGAKRDSKFNQWPYVTPASTYLQYSLGSSKHHHYNRLKAYLQVVMTDDYFPTSTRLDTSQNIPNGFCQHHFLTGLLGSLEVHAFGDKYSVLPDCPAEGWKFVVDAGWGGVGMLPLWNLHTCSSRSGGSVRVKFLHIERKITSVVHSHPPSHYIRKHASGHVMFTTRRTQNN